jgi:hypothetical protein
MTRRYKASKYPLYIVVGEDFSWSWVYRPDGVDQPAKDWTGYTGKAQLRTKATSEEELLEFTVTLGADGTVRIEADRDETKDLKPGQAVWDIFTTDPEGKVERFLAGPATIEPQVTR